ncbi:MAG: TetR/AcrR family transcriptional regulator [Myxococcales bacterium]|nr:TetR/AcrR family transcriptional regulator [Myxococcales bacterium]
MPKIVDHDQRREELLTTSFALFAQRGYSAVTMRELARELEVSTGLLYYYFPNKEALFEQMFTLMSQRDVVRVTAELDPDSPIPEKLSVLFKYLSRNESHFQNLLLMALDFHRQNVEHGKGHVLQEIVRIYSDAIEDRLKLTGSRFGSIIFSFLCGMFFQRLLAPQISSIQEHSVLMQQLLSNLSLPEVTDSSPSNAQEDA